MATEERDHERRHYERFNGKTYGVMFRKLGTSSAAEVDAYHTGKTVDISKGGMRFETEEPLEGGDRIQYFVDSPSGKHGREGTAQVVRAEQAGGWFSVAVEFQA